MNRLIPAVVGLFTFGLSLLAEPAPTNTCRVQVYFSPMGGCTDAVVAALRSATNSILVQAFSLTSTPIAQALIKAHERGVRVSVILDRTQRTEKYSAATLLSNAGIRTLIDDSHAAAHNKIIVVDQHLVITGSFNFTKAAEQNNAENLLVLDDPAVAAIYAGNWNDHEGHAGSYVTVENSRAKSP